MVPATGRQDVLLTLDAPTALHFSARSASGTSCELVDRVRGPFARAGTAGSINCELDLLLDAGEYKARLESPRRGKGNVTLSATPFSDINDKPLRLTDGVGFVTTLKPRQQASYWLKVDARDASPTIRIAGRHAGDVRLWRNGEWLEPISLAHREFSPVPGEPMHEWWLENTLEAGEYKLVIYGRGSTTVTGSSVDESLTVEYGVREAPPERNVSFTLPVSGVFAVKVPTTAVGNGGSAFARQPAQVARSICSSMTASCVIHRLPAASRRMRSSPIAAPRSAAPRDASSWYAARPAHAAISSGRSIATTPPVTGAADTTVPAPARSRFPAAATRALPLVGVVDVPNDSDAAPLGCQLERVDARGEVQETIARSAVRLSEGEMLEREFNYDEQGAVIWFELGSGTIAQRVGLSSRRYQIATTGGRKNACEIYKVGDKASSLDSHSRRPPGRVQRAAVARCRLLPDSTDARPHRRRQAHDQGRRRRARAKRGFARRLRAAQCANLRERYRLILNRLGAAVRVRGLYVQSLPITGEAPLHLQLDARQTLELPVRLSNPASVRSAAAVPFGCALSAGRVSMKVGACDLTAGSDTLTLANPSDTPINLTLSRPGGLVAFASPASYSPALKPLARIETETPTWLDFEREQTHAVAFDVESPGLYNVTTAGCCRPRAACAHR
jgi:hypothetical protein